MLDVNTSLGGVKKKRKSYATTIRTWTTGEVLESTQMM